MVLKLSVGQDFLLHVRDHLTDQNRLQLQLVPYVSSRCNWRNKENSTDGRWASEMSRVSICSMIGVTREGMVSLSSLVGRPVSGNKAVMDSIDLFKSKRDEFCRRLGFSSLGFSSIFVNPGIFCFVEIESLCFEQSPVHESCGRENDAGAHNPCRRQGTSE